MQIEPSTFTTEFDLVVNCARLDGLSRGGERVRSLSGPRVDWTSVLALAQRHGVTALLHDSLREADAPRVPARLRRVLEGRASSEGERKVRLRAALGTLLDAFADRRIDVIPLACARLARSPTVPVELDLLVRRDDVAATWTMLAGRGFVPEVPLKGARLRTFVRAHGARRFVDASGGVVSIQWEVADPAVAHGPSAAALWHRAWPATLEERSCLLLSPVDWLELACVRGTIKRWQRLMWVRQIAETVADGDSPALDDALAHAARRGTLRAVALGTGLAARLLGAPGSPRLTTVTREPAVAGLTRTVLSDMMAVPRALAGPSDIARFHLRSRERLRDKVRYTVRRATLPGGDDVAALRLPPSLFALGRALVPWGRAVRAGMQWARRARGIHGRAIARFVRTPPHVIDRMLALADVTAADRLLDLGCGDGAIVVRAAERVGCRAIGVDIDAQLLEMARRRARAAGVAGLVDFRYGAAREADLAWPTVVCTYLSATSALRPRLQRDLRPGARLVSFNFDLGDWWADEVEIVDEIAWGSNTLYLWRIDAPEVTRSAAS